MKRSNTIGLSLATLLIAIAAPLSLQPQFRSFEKFEMPQVGLGTARAIASQPLLAVQGTLGAEHEITLSSGRRNRAVFHRFSGQAGQTVAIALTSSEFRTVVALVDTNTRQIIDANQGPQNDSSLQLRLPYTGSYVVMVSSMQEDAQGSYRLTVVSSR
jgi:hypothetical protein